MKNARREHPLELSYGIEEEFFLVEPTTYDLSQPPPGFFKACRLAMGECVGEELLQAQVEIATPVLRSAGQAREALAHLRGELARLAARYDLQLLAAGTHPFATWRGQCQTDKARYDELIDDFQIVGRRNLFCGMHVHVGVPDGHDRVVLMNRLLKWLPMFLALSTSSPFWRGRSTGLLSYRQAAYDEWPRSGIPDAFSSEREYAEFVRLLASCGALRDASYLWWAIRPSARFPTLELRIADACTRQEDALALAAAFRCLVRAYLRQPELCAVASPMTRRIVDENRWRAKRFGTDAEFIDEATASAPGFHATLAEFRDLVREDAAELGCEREIAHLSTIVERGTSAHAQLAAHRGACMQGRSGESAMRRVVDWLLSATRGEEPAPALATLSRHADGLAAIA